MSIVLTKETAQFFGGRVCLDFANSLDWRLTDSPVELVPDYAALLVWSGLRGTLPARAVARLRANARQRPHEAAAALRDAHALRAELWQAAEALCRDEGVALAPFNRLLATAPPQPRLVRGGRGYVHDLPGDSLAEPLWPVLWSLTALLAAEDSVHVGSCQAQGCGWFFVDASPNRSRLWCSSEICGNRERARRAYAKRRAG